MFIVSDHYAKNNAIAELVIHYCRGASTGPMMSNTKREQAERDGRDYGFRKGIAFGIAELLTLVRVGTFPLFERHEKINTYDVESILDESMPGLKTFVPDEVETSQIVDKLLALVDGPEGSIAAKHETLRRSQILDGRLRPEANDLGWLKELQAEHEAKILLYRELAKKVED